MKKSFKGQTELIFIIFSLVLISALLAYVSLMMPLSAENKWREIRIPEGSTYSQSISILKDEGLIKNKLVFLILGKITVTERKLRAGYYNLNTSMSALKMFNKLRKGMIVEYFITIPEGSTLDDIKLKLKDKDLINDTTWEIVEDKQFLDSLGIDAPSLEGFLYPDTYNFAKGADQKDIFRIMVQRLREAFHHTLRKRADELGMNEKQILTLASIIEREAIFNRERPIISAVYHNRLKKNMRLQADPTVVYGIKRMQDGITRADLKRKTPYNTYVINGLPPGPIASPGINSIKAALYPSNVDFLYFVSRNNGTHYFSVSGEEHMKAVRLYQRKKRSRKNRAVASTAGSNKPADRNKKTDEKTKEKTD